MRVDFNFSCGVYAVVVSKIDLYYKNHGEPLMLRQYNFLLNFFFELEKVYSIANASV